MLFLAAALAICILHYRAETNIRGTIPPHSDSLSYQNEALVNMAHFQSGKLSLAQLLFGIRNDNPIPPLHKISIMLGYFAFGVNNFSPYLVSGLWMLLLALGMYLVVRFHSGNEIMAFSAGLFVLALPGALTYGFAETRNDWPVAALCMTSFYFFISSDSFKNRNRALIAGLLAGLALITKSSLPGYLGFPALFLCYYLYTQRNVLGKAAYTNVALSILAVIAVAGWFYIAKINDIATYYSFWSSEKLADVRAQYGLQTIWDELRFYADNFFRQMGVAGAIVALLGCLSLAFSWAKGRVKLSAPSGFTITWAAVFAFAPYIILYTRRSYASLADINMLPFQIFVGFAGLTFLLKSEINVRRFSIVMAVLAVFLNIVSVAEHNRIKYYQGVDPQKGADQFVELLDQAEYNKTVMWGLYQDIYFNPATLLNIILRAPISRAKIDARLPDVRLQTIFSPNMDPADRYKKISDLANTLLITSSPRGAKWIAANREWGAMRKLVSNDDRYSLLGRLTPYDDGTKVDVFVKNSGAANITADGWLVNEGKIRIFSKPGRYKLLVEGYAHGSTVADMKITPEGGEHGFMGSPCESNGKMCYEFVIETVNRHSAFKITSDSPLIPSDLGTSADTRELLLHNPSVKIMLMQETDGR